MSVQVTCKRAWTDEELTEFDIMMTHETPEDFEVMVKGSDCDDFQELDSDSWFRWALRPLALTDRSNSQSIDSSQTSWLNWVLSHISASCESCRVIVTISESKGVQSEQVSIGRDMVLSTKNRLRQRGKKASVEEFCKKETAKALLDAYMNSINLDRPTAGSKNQQYGDSGEFDDFDSLYPPSAFYKTPRQVMHSVADITSYVNPGLGGWWCDDPDLQINGGSKSIDNVRSYKPYNPAPLDAYTNSINLDRPTAESKNQLYGDSGKFDYLDSLYPHKSKEKGLFSGTSKPWQRWMDGGNPLFSAFQPSHNSVVFCDSTGICAIGTS